MNITINGEKREVPGNPSLKQAVEDLGYQTQFVAIAVNMKCVPRKEWETHCLQEWDEIEILSPQSGG